MPRQCFYSFYYAEDSWRVSTVKGIGAIEGQPIVSGNEWEEVERGGDKAIQKWIDDNMVGRTCLIVLAGTNTAGRKWVDYEIKKAWQRDMGVLAIHIHNLKDRDGNQSKKGKDPLAGWKVNGEPMSKWAKTYDPPYSQSQNVYNYIAENIESWVEEAITLRKKVT